MSLIKNNIEIELMKDAGKRLSDVFLQINFKDLIGRSTKEIDIILKDKLLKNKLESQAYGYNGFSGYSCLSLNNQLVHGVPKKDVFVLEKDVLKIDICAKYNGYCADMARMYADFDGNLVYKKMNECAERSLQVAFNNSINGGTVGTIGSVIEREILSYGFSVVVDFCGHGIGRFMHEDPEVPNFGKKDKGQRLYNGMAIAIEPMFCQYKADLFIDEVDGWTASTIDGGVAAHIEDTVIICDDLPIITTRLLF
jgi:methionyl aminopeptidase